MNSQRQSLLSKVPGWAWTGASTLAKMRLTPVTTQALQGSGWEVAVKETMRSQTHAIQALPVNGKIKGDSPKIKH